MRLRRISIRRYRATLLQGSTHVGPELQIYAKPQHKGLNLIAVFSRDKSKLRQQAKASRLLTTDYRLLNLKSLYTPSYVLCCPASHSVKEMHDKRPRRKFRGPLCCVRGRRKMRSHHLISLSPQILILSCFYISPQTVPCASEPQRCFRGWRRRRCGCGSCPGGRSRCPGRRPLFLPSAGGRRILLH